MMNRYSSRLHRLDEAFLNKKLLQAKQYDRIAGYFCSSILEVAGESIESVSGTVRVICNSGLSPEDVKVAVEAQRLKQEWCDFVPEEKYASLESSARLSRLYRLLKSGKLEVRVIPDEVYGLMHGKAGVITYEDGTKTSFLGSINETKSAFKLNYEMIWEDDDSESVQWVQSEFDFFWNNKYAVKLCDFVVEDIHRIANRTVKPLQKWREEPEDIPAAAVEEPVFRHEFGLWEHQKYFVELAFREHQKDGGARFLLADQVGLGKTIQLAMAAKLMALYGDKPILIIVPKTLIFQWQDEMQTLLDMPSAVWTGQGWQDETGYFCQVESVKAILKCPRRVGIISQGLVARRTDAAELLLDQNYECVILDEAHRARRRNPTRDPNKNKADPNYLLDFLNKISVKTTSLLLATATPVQVNTIEAFDLLNVLALSSEKVMGDIYSTWRRKPQQMLDMVCSIDDIPDSENTMWDIVRNPFPPRSKGSIKINSLRDSFDAADNDYVLSADLYKKSRQSVKDKIHTLYTADQFILNYNPYIRHIVRRTREFLENSINPATGKSFLKKITVKLLGENQAEAIALEGYQRQAYQKAQEFCALLSQRVKAGGFMSTLVLKRIGSTIIAGENTARKMLAWTEEGRQILMDQFDVVFEDDEEVDEAEEVSEVKRLRPEEIQCLHELVELLSLNHDKDPKYGIVLDILQNGIEEDRVPWKEKGCILFSQYYDSARFVAESLSQDMDEPIGLYAGGDKSGVFQNGVFRKALKDEIKAMVKRREIKILIGTDAASEGLNLQTLSSLINIDLPWNPTRLEQRKGRIQRIGQMSETVWIYNMRYRGSVEDKVHQVLSERLNDIYNMFGQIPDTLEDVWIDIAMNDEAKAKERINSLPKKNPFALKYETQIPETENWEACTVVLDKKDKMMQLMKRW